MFRLSRKPKNQKESAATRENTVETTRRSRVVIVGAGFGGMAALKVLGNSELEVVLINRTNYYGFWPLLYQVATAGLEAHSIAYPLRVLLRKFKNIEFKLAEATRVDLENRQVLTDRGPVQYDYLVLAAGCTNNYFGKDSLAQETFSLKDLDDAILLRNHLLSSFEEAATETDPERRKVLLTFLVIGAGPTGVELSGALCELIKHVLRKDYPALDLTKARVVLVEGASNVLPPFNKPLQNKARRQLANLGVEVITNQLVASVQDGVITFKDGSVLKAGTVVWGAGSRSAVISDTLGVKQVAAARVKVEKTLQLPTHPEVYAVGDMSYLEGYRKDKDTAYPMLAPVAIQQGLLAGLNILASYYHQPLKDFHYKDRGAVATIGRNAAVYQFSNFGIGGWLAWISWLFLHLLTLVGFRNRVLMLASWAYNYFTYDRTRRVIFKSGGDRGK